MHDGRTTQTWTTHPRADPLAIISIYRSPATTDWIRIIIVCVVHPIVQEFVMTVYRTRERLKLALVVKDSKMHYHGLVSMGGAYGLEHTLVMYRRVMIGCMVDTAASILAVVLTAVEEAILRSTMVYRDNFFARLQGLPEPTEAELEHKVGVWLRV